MTIESRYDQNWDEDFFGNADDEEPSPRGAPLRFRGEPPTPDPETPTPAESTPPNQPQQLELQLFDDLAP